MGQPAGSCRLRRRERVRNRKDFARLQGRGPRQRSAHFVLFAGPTWPSVRHPEGVPRLGLTVSRKVGGAVRRNLVKRRVRAYFREHRCAFGSDTDVVVIARPGAAELGPVETRNELCQLFGGGAR
jgi:ribonuclease P protein component